MNDSPMHPETLKALHLSIRKWERIVARKGIDQADSNCPLCTRFLWGPNEDGFVGSECSRVDGDIEEQCPVAAAAGQDMCEGTPYQDWAQAWACTCHGRLVEDDETVMCAVLELEFLRDLLPSRRKPE